MWQCKKCCTENEDQLSYCKNCGMSKAKSLRQPRLNKKKNKEQQNRLGLRIRSVQEENQGGTEHENNINRNQRS